MSTPPRGGGRGGRKAPTRRRSGATKTTRQAAGKRAGKTPARKPAAKKPAVRKAASRRKAAPARGTASRRRWWRPVLKTAAALALLLFLTGVGLVAWITWDLPDVARLAPGKRPGITVLAADGHTVLAAFGEVQGRVVTPAVLPDHLVQALLATEDRRFYDHVGIDPLGIARALVTNVMAGGIRQGASTLTQQLAKNLFLSPERTLKRKLQEVLLAFWLEQRFTKDELLTVYLNRVYLGAGTFGVDAAARRYFGKPAGDLTLAEAAVIAGLPKAPSRYNPLTSRQRARARMDDVLDNMVEAGWLAPAAAEAARREGFTVAALTTGRAERYFADWVMAQIEGFVGLGDRDLVVVTTLDPAIQAAAEQAMVAALDGPGRAVKAGQGALLAMAPDGAVRAMVGGRHYDNSQFNRATQARRQPGSVFKPVVYLAALEAGWLPDSPIADRPIRVGNWTPGNFDGRFRGSVTLRQALGESLNAAVVRLAERIGRERVVAMAARLGLGRPDPDPSLALGTAETTLLDITAAYASFANGGQGVIPYGISQIRDRDGAVLYRRRGGGTGPVASAMAVAALDDMLRSAVRDGTGRAAAVPGLAVAGKTGTSQAHRDAWFVGYGGDLVAGVWFGNDDARPMDRVTGGGLPARTWQTFMAAARRR